MNSFTKLLISILILLILGGTYYIRKMRSTLQQTTDMIPNTVQDASKQENSSNNTGNTSSIINDSDIINLDMDSKKERELQNDTNNAPQDRLSYKDTIVGMNFKYPPHMKVYDHLGTYSFQSSSPRLTISNYSYDEKDMFMKTGKFPNDIFSLQINFDQINENSYQNIEEFIDEKNKRTKTDEILTINGQIIYKFYYNYDPNSERAGVGPYLERYFERNGYLVNMIVADYGTKEENEKSIIIAEEILRTLYFPN